MTLTLFVQLLINGLTLGLNLALVALGLTLIFGILRIFNFAHGEFYMLGMFGAYYFFEVAGLNFFVAIILSMVIMGSLGILMERVLFRPVRGELLAPFIISLGLAIAMPGAALIGFGGTEKAVTPAFPGLVNFAGISISVERLAVLGIGLALIFGLYLFITRTKVGQAMSAVAQDSEAAAMQGVDVNFICLLGFGLSCALAAAAGTLLAPMRYISPFVGGPAVIEAAIVIVLGGLGSFPGAVVGALILGMADSFGAAFAGGYFKLIGFVILIIILLLRPSGLLGREHD
jgi:branched-chain amino acid transport system permease protein